MNCPECGEATVVYESRPGYRRRKCRNGHRFKTVETLFNPSSIAPLKSYKLHMLRTMNRMGVPDTKIAEKLPAPIEVVWWYLKDIKTT